jgi:hypothetical protein
MRTILNDLRLSVPADISIILYNIRGELIIPENDYNTVNEVPPTP